MPEAPREQDYIQDATPELPELKRYGSKKLVSMWFLVLYYHMVIKITALTQCHKM